MTDQKGRQLGNYRLMSLLGQGGFADVYLGEHVYLNTQAAIKVLHAQLTQDMRGHFLGEAQTIARLRHPHIVRVLDFGVENMIPFLVMEFAPNGTLRQLYPRGSRLSLHLIVSYIKQIAGALQHAHDQRLVHRDVKPENILLGYNNQLLLSDFGIATIAHTSRSLHTQDFSGVNCVAWSHNTPYIVSGSGDKTAQVWDAFNGKLVSIYNGHTNEVLVVAWSLDNSNIASASDDDTVQIWDTMNGHRYVNYTGHTGFVVAMAWSPNGKYIASGGVDTTVQAWQALDGTLISSFTGHSAEVESVTWSPDGKHVASASDDRTVQVWQMQ